MTETATPAAKAIYRGMDQAALDAAYNNSAVVADSQEWVGRWREKSAAIRASDGAKLDIPYGPRPRARLDYFPSGAKGRAAVCVHPRRLLAAQREGHLRVRVGRPARARHQRRVAGLYAGAGRDR